MLGVLIKGERREGRVRCVCVFVCVYVCVCVDVIPATHLSN